jgi:DNA-3-methyladenine glycosylase
MGSLSMKLSKNIAGSFGVGNSLSASVVKFQKLPRSFYARDAVTVARALLGMNLVHVMDGVARVGKIVETEAYLGPHDLASHSSKGRTKRTEVMFGPAGHAYVYLIYGIHWNMNVVCARKDVAAAVLLRALEPVMNLTGRTQGPGLLCKAMGIDKTRYGWDLLSDELFVARPKATENIKVVRTTRIGVDYAGAWAARPQRFFIDKNPFVSKPARRAAFKKTR